MSKHGGGKRRREAAADGAREGQADEGGGGGGSGHGGGHAKAASALGRHHDKHQRPAHTAHKKPRAEPQPAASADAAAAAEPEKKKKKKKKFKKKRKAPPSPLAPPPPKPGAVAAALLAGSNWAQLRAKLADGAEDSGGGGKKRPGPAHHHHHHHRRPTINELAGRQQQRRQQQQQQQQQQQRGGEEAASAPGADPNPTTTKKKELRPITALTPEVAPGPIVTGASAALAAVVATATATTAAAAAANGNGNNSDGAVPDAAAPLTPVLAIDCEMVGVGPEGKRSALARVCLVNDRGHVVLDTFVAPREAVTDYRTWVSGVRPEDVRHAPPLERVQRRVAELVSGRVLVGHSLSGDLRALLLSHPRKLVRDTARYPPLMRRAHRAPQGMADAAVASDIARGKRRPKALRVLAAQELGLEIQAGEHTPVDDARAALYLYLRHAREWERAVRRGDVSRLPVGVGGGAQGVAAAVAAAQQARALKRQARQAGGGGAGGKGVRSNTLDVRELARQDPYADL
jgi:RNA exonuclease 4